MRIKLIVVLTGLVLGQVTCLNEVITNWNTYDGSTTYNGSKTDVTGISYDSNYVYIQTNGLPSYLKTYSIYSWTSNPNKATAQSYITKFALSPSQNTGTKTSTIMGANGFWTNGMPIYNAKDGYSYNSLGVWNRDAYLFEGVSFDTCGGHPDGSGRYHNHLNPTCLYNSTDSSSHSSIIGWAFDGYPIYGPFGYSSANDSSSTIRRILPSYSLRSITTRTTLWDGTVLNSTYYGPDVNSTYYIGYYIEDWGYSSSNGDLDQYNGRYCVTPEYPDGTYAYFIPTYSNGTAAFPYSLASQFYGTVWGFATSLNISSLLLTTYF